MTNHPDQQSRNILRVGASRGLGQDMATEFMERVVVIARQATKGRRA